MSKQYPHAHVSRILLTAGAAALLAACSSDIERLSDYPPIDNTSSVAPSKVASQPLPPANNASGPWNNPTPSWARGKNNVYSPPPPVRIGQRRPAPPAYSQAQRTAGTIIVRPGQTLFSIAKANGKSVSELMAANGLRSPDIRVGQRLVIPGVANPVSPAPTVHPASAPGAMNVKRLQVRSHRVQPGETWFALGRRYRVHPRKIAAYNGLSLHQGLKVGQVVKIPPSDGWSMAAVAQPTPPTHVSRQSKKDQTRIAEGPNRPAQTSPARESLPETAPTPPASSAFIWPVRGRVIARFGKQANGQRNDGIDIAAAEGTPVRAAADGTVAYAGNELKAYGNLVLIRHKGGWVTAYAYNRDLQVRRGDRVRQGQVIAHVGSTGVARSPQLHFELRKGPLPVDPMRYLGTLTAMR